MTEIKKRVQDKITINEIIQLKDSGLTYREIGTMFGVSRQMIHGLVKKYQSNDGPIKLNDKIISLLKNDFIKSRVSLKEYSANIGLSVYTIKSILSNNVTKIKKSNLIKISTALNVPMTELIKVDDTDKPKFLPSNSNDCHNIYKKIAYKNIIDGSSFFYKGRPIDGCIEISKETANIIIAYRLSRGLSITDFSKCIGVSISLISQLESYKSLKLKYSSLIKISNALNITVEQLLNADKPINIDIDSVDFKIKLNKSIADKIRCGRLELSLTQDELGNMCGVKQDFISRLELGVLKSTKESIFKNICIALNLDYRDLINKNHT